MFLCHNSYKKNKNEGDSTNVLRHGKNLLTLLTTNILHKIPLFIQASR